MAAAVILGGFVFSAPFEVPNKINFGGTQRVAEHHLIGSSLVIDAMGPTPADITWSGRFRGGSAIARAQALDSMRKTGAQYVLAWLGVAYNVVITNFSAETEKAYEVPFSITCKPTDNGGGGGGGIANLDSLVGGDLYTLGSVSALAQNSVLAAISGLSGAVTTANVLQGASSATLNPVVAAATSVVAATASGIAANEATLAIPSPDGTLPGISSAWLSTASATASGQSVLADSLGYASRIALNLQLGSI
jgi:hypothetical protein